MRKRAGLVAAFMVTAFMVATLPDVDTSFALGVLLSSGASAVVEEVVVTGCAVVPSLRGWVACEMPR